MPSCEMLQPIRNSRLHDRSPPSPGGCAAEQFKAHSWNSPASLKLPDAIEIEPMLPLQLRSWIVWEWAPGVNIHSPRSCHETPILRHLHAQWALTLSKGTHLHEKRCIGLITQLVDGILQDFAAFCKTLPDFSSAWEAHIQLWIELPA